MLLTEEPIADADIELDGFPVEMTDDV